MRLPASGVVLVALSALAWDGTIAWANSRDMSAMPGTMGEFETLFGAAESYRDVLRGIAAVTPDRVGEALGRWVGPDRAVRAWVGPNGA